MVFKHATKTLINKFLDEEIDDNNTAKALQRLTLNSTPPKSEFPIKKEWVLVKYLYENVD